MTRPYPWLGVAADPGDEPADPPAPNGIDLDAIGARTEAATSGPWTHEPYGGQNQNGDYSGGCVYDADGEWVVSEVGDNEGAFIAHAREDIPLLLAVVKNLGSRVIKAEELNQTLAKQLQKSAYRDVDLAKARSSLSIAEAQIVQIRRLADSMDLDLRYSITAEDLRTALNSSPEGGTDEGR